MRQSTQSASASAAIKSDIREWLVTKAPASKDGTTTTTSSSSIIEDSDVWQVLSERYDRSLKTVQNLAGIVRAELREEDHLSSPLRPQRGQTVVLSDLHIPYHHKDAVTACLKLLEAIKPEHLVLNGDVLDCYSVSSFAQDPRLPVLQGEIRQAKEFLQECRRILPDAKISFLEGNHEERLGRTIANRNPGFNGLEALTWPNLLGLDDLTISFTAYKQHITVYDNIQITHGHKVSKHSAYSAKAHLLDGGYQNVLIGHTHRMGSYYLTGVMGTRRAYEIGGLYDRRQAGYVVNPNWQNGFAILSSYQNRLSPVIELIEIDHVEGSFTYEGVEYKA